MKKLYLKVVGDYNDGDYVTEETNIAEWNPKDVLKVISLLKIVINYKESSSPNWARYDNYDKLKKNYPEFSEEDFERIQEVIPCFRDGVHTICSAEVIEVESILHV